MKRGRYNTCLKRQVEQELKNSHGITRITYIARKLRANISSVWYQVQQLVKENKVYRIGKKIVYAAKLAFRTVWLSVIKYYRNLKKRYIRKTTKTRKQKTKPVIIGNPFIQASKLLS